jgi:GUN4-like/NACHT domain
VVTGIWAAYTENFLARCREIAGDRGREDPDRLLALAKKVDSAIRWQLSGTQGRYLKAQANACEEYTVEGSSKAGGWKLLLDEVYVPLEVSGGAMFWRLEQSTRANLAALEKEQEELSLWKLLSQVRQVPAYRQMAILAKGGFGKTTLLRHVTYGYAIKPKRVSRLHKVPVLIPFLLYLRDWRGEIAQPNAPDLPTLIRQHHIPKLPEGEAIQLPPNWVASVLRQGKALVMFDGFDEVAEHQRVAVGQWISQQMANYPRSVFILTSRPEGYEEYTKCPGAQRLSAIYVKPFSPAKRNQFIKSWYLGQERYERGNRDTPTVRDIAKRQYKKLIAEIESRPELAVMAENPLMLDMIASFHRFNAGGHLPARRTDLYGDICQMQLWDRPKARYVDMLLRPQASKAILQRVALQMTQRPEPTVKLPIAELNCLAATYLAQVTDEAVDAGKFVQQIKTVSELFTERDLQEYEFSHRSFQDYLAACELAENHAVEVVIDNLENKWWRETILLYAELVNPSKLIEAAIKMGTPTAIDVAYRCLQMGTNLTRVAPALQAQLQVAMPLRSQLQDKRYEKLEALLKAGEWKAADNETYELMIRTVGKEPGQDFLPQELLTFPCDDLLRIDGLWVQYSQGKFGFSVQKEIYERCGGVLDGKYYEKPYAHFFHAVGWCKDDATQYDDVMEYVRKRTYRPYAEFIFSPEVASRGHLPSPPGADLFVNRIVNYLFSLLSHPDL